MFKKFFDNIFDFIYPNKCVFCSKEFVKNTEFLCQNCRKNFCTKSKIIDINLDNNFSIKCLYPFKYEGIVKEAICRFKFKGYKNYSDFFGSVLAEEIKNKFSKIKFDYICSVPLRKERKRNRGFNQAECLALSISCLIDIPTKDFLEKIKSNHIQHELDLKNRIENVKGVYAIKNGSQIKGKTILLCDDIVTTGSTLQECSKILLEGGAKKVYCCAVAGGTKFDFLNKHI